MKSKKFVEKLALNKKTVADLNSKEMKDVFGGITNSCEPTCLGCDSFFITCTVTYSGTPKCVEC